MRKSESIVESAVSCLPNSDTAPATPPVSYGGELYLRKGQGVVPNHEEKTLHFLGTKPAAQAAGADLSECKSTNRQILHIQQNWLNS